MKGEKVKTEMNKSQEPKINLEHGITLIALVITVVLLVILAALVLKAVSGDNNLIGAATEGTENYKVAEYKELISAEVLGIIQSNMIKGKETTLDNLAEGIGENVAGVKRANTYTDETITNADILVTTNEGYVFQVYYNDAYGVYNIEYLGKGEESDFPTVTASYKKKDTKIEARASISSGQMKSLEILYRDEVLKPNEGSTSAELTKTITEAGWYKIKATGENGKIRYAWVRVTSLNGDLEPPTIHESNGIHGIERMV